MAITISAKKYDMSRKSQVETLGEMTGGSTAHPSRRTMSTAIVNAIEMTSITRGPMENERTKKDTHTIYLYSFYLIISISYILYVIEKKERPRSHLTICSRCSYFFFQSCF